MPQPMQGLPTRDGGNGDSGSKGQPSQPSAADDVARALRDRTVRTSLRALEQRGFRQVHVLDLASIQKIVSESVDRALDRRREALSPEDRAAVESEVKQDFLRLVEEHKKLQAAKTESERHGIELTGTVRQLREELERNEHLLKSERSRKLDPTKFAITPEGFAQLEDKIRKLFAKLMDGERRLSLAEVGPKALQGLTEVEKELAVILDNLFIGERDRFLGKASKEQQEKISLYERRIEKLNKTRAETEEALRYLANAKGFDPGLASIYKGIQGLDSHDPKYGRKKELLKVVFLENLALQKRATSGELEELENVPHPR